MTLGAGLAVVVSVRHQPWTTTQIAAINCGVESDGGTQTVTLTPALAQDANNLNAITVSLRDSTSSSSEGNLSFTMLVPRNGQCASLNQLTQFPNDDHTPGQILAARWSGPTSDQPSVTVYVGEDVTGSLLICNLVPSALGLLKSHKVSSGLISFGCPPLSGVTNGPDGVRYYDTYDVQSRTNATVGGGFVIHHPALAMQVACGWNVPDNSPYGCRDIIASIFKTNSTNRS